MGRRDIWRDGVNTQISKTIVYLLNFVYEEGTEHVCEGFVIFALGQNSFRLSVQYIVQLLPQFVGVSRVIIDDFGVEITLSFVNDGITLTN